MTTLLLVDVQNDFHPGGSLAIPTANEDAERIAELIRSSGDKIQRIVATLDSHHKLHIAHPCFWVDEQGLQHPPPFTLIHSSDIESGKWKPRPNLNLSTFSEVDKALFSDLPLQEDGVTLDLPKYVLEYTRRLERKGRFQLCIWPEHCLIGTEGHAVVPQVRKALDEWSDKTGGSVEFVMKGQHLLTEMYSALQAEVPVTEKTSFNQELQNSLLQSKQLLVCGQAMSHCVNYTFRDIVEQWPEERRGEVVLLSDCASAVPGFETAAETFQTDVRELGVQICQAKDVKFAEE